jgi:adenine-specific DNA-methyltransferase
MKISSEDILKYSQTKNSSKRSFGEVFTPEELINEMLDTLPSSVWDNPELTWLDPAAGMGNFFAVAYNRLMLGLSKKIKNETTRRKHILEKMFYFVEIQKKSVERIEEIFNPNKELSLNIYAGDFFLFNKFGPNIGKFDIVLGNPPYQEMMTENTRKAKNHNLWSMFVEKGFELVKKNGFLLYVTPPAWMSPSSKLLVNIFLKHQLHVVNINECSRHFKGIGSQFSYYLIQKKQTYKKTKFIYNFKGGTNIKAQRGTSEYKLNEKIRFIPQLPTAEVFSILEKTVFSEKPKYDIRYDSDLHRFTKKELLSDIKDSRFKHRVMHTPTQIVWSVRPHKNQNKIKIFIPLTTYYESLMVETCGNTQGMGYLLCENTEEAENIKNILSSKLYRFIANVTRWSNFNVPLVIKNLPEYPHTNQIEEQHIYRYFKLNHSEKKALESIKEQKSSKMKSLFDVDSTVNPTSTQLRPIYQF